MGGVRARDIEILTSMSTHIVHVLPRMRCRYILRAPACFISSPTEDDVTLFVHIPVSAQYLV